MNKPIGVFDSGVGGLTVAREILRHLPDETIVYFGDTARVPYGTKSREAITRFALEDARFLVSKDVKMIVVACNSVSSNALGRLKEEFGIPVLGVIEPGARAACRTTRNNKVGVIGTSATIESGAYKEAIHRCSQEVDVISAACPLFVPLVEEGWLDKKITVDVAKEYLVPLLEKGIDTLLLGCTHYPLLERAIAMVTGSEVTLVDSAETTAKEVAELVRSGGPVANGHGERAHQFFLSDIPRNFTEIGKRFLGREIEPVQRVDLSPAFHARANPPSLKPRRADNSK